MERNAPRLVQQRPPAISHRGVCRWAYLRGGDVVTKDAVSQRLRRACCMAAGKGRGEGSESLSRTTTTTTMF
jgi:hypothetical protein